MVNDAFVKDLTKALISDTSGKSELTPGSVGRRYEPAGGIKSHNDRIHRESKISNNKELPFTFSKPYKPTGRVSIKLCAECGHAASVKESTISMICSSCKQYVKVLTLEDFEEAHG